MKLFYEKPELFVDLRPRNGLVSNIACGKGRSSSFRFFSHLGLC
jgi:hypothetical protein